MASAVQSNSFLDSAIARIIGLVIALLLAFLLWSNWSSELTELVSGKAEQSTVVSVTEPAKPANTALDACFKQRVGDVDKMKEEGILSDAQYAAFRSRAEDLCRAQNQG